MLPFVIEKHGKSTDTFDLYSKLFQDRIIMINGEINSNLCNEVIMQLLYLDSVSDDEITIYINSEGGSVIDGLAIKDVIHKINSKVNTIGVGKCASMGAYLLSMGTGERKCMENCQILLHTVSTTMNGNLHTLRIDLEQTEKLNKIVFDDLINICSIPKEKLEELTKYDCWLSSNKALELNLIDRII